jgi:hypothetical protein
MSRVFCETWDFTHPPETPMRLIAAAVLLIFIPLIFIPVTVWELTESPSRSEPSTTLYDANPSHTWNRLYAALLIREDRHGTQLGADSLDPLLWTESEHLLAKPSHERALHALDEFLQTHAENLIRDPVKRALMQRDLWAVFDWSVQQDSRSKRPRYDAEKQQLQARLAEVLRRIALSPQELEALPDNYPQAAASGAFAREYAAAHPDQPFLPLDLFDHRGPWVNIDASPELYNSGGIAQEHLHAFGGRSGFLVFMRLPEGRKATLAYLQTLWNFPQPWVQFPDPRGDQVVVNPDLPSFPTGTEVALVRQMTLFDSQGNLAPAPITESVQIRVYREITTTPARYFGSGDMNEIAKDSGQDFYEFKLSRALLFAGKAGGLRATGRDERELSTFQQQGDDEIEEFDEHPEFKKMWAPALQSCLSCHSGGGVRSFNSLDKLFKPNRRQQDPPDNGAYPARWWLNDGSVAWKQDRYDWGLLNGYWKTAARQQ